VSRSLRLVACVAASAALGAAALVVVLNALVASRGEESLSAVATVLFVLGVGAPACVGLFLVLRRPRTLVAWILLVGALSVGVVMAAVGVAALALDDDPGSRLGAWALLVSQEWLVLFAWPLALAFTYPDGRLPSRRW
jgi:hypothetical protein